ncbi:hypothetical protein HT094_22345 [Shewanella sp. ZOR0012]|nr:hypothetical protein [Shewanella sp. ZOR0012]
MKKSPLLNLLIASVLLAGNSFANTEKMTYEKAMESDKKTFHNNSVPLQETIDNWNTYVKAPTESSSGEVVKCKKCGLVSQPQSKTNGEKGLF